jgi:predicted negative regulator of RcsB-dependent stress response
MDKEGKHVKDYLKGTFAVVAGLAVLGAVILGGWQAGWWFTNQNANREAHVIRNSYSNQQTLRDQITKGLGDVMDMDHQIAQATGDNKTTLIAQRRAIANLACQEAEQVTGDDLPTDQQSWVADNCVMGSAK